MKAEGRRVGLSHATSLRTSEWPSARRIWREREERESVREGERRRRHRRSTASVASNQPSPPSNVCSIHARKREGPDTDGRRDGKRARPSSGELLQNFKLHSAFVEILQRLHITMCIRDGCKVYGSYQQRVCPHNVLYISFIPRPFILIAHVACTSKCYL